MLIGTYHNYLTSQIARFGEFSRRAPISRNAAQQMELRWLLVLIKSLHIIFLGYKDNYNNAYMQKFIEFLTQNNV